jgi:hypothetical protein
MTPDYLQSAITKMSEALIDYEFGVGESQGLNDTSKIAIDVRDAMVIYIAAKAYHEQGTARQTVDNAVIAAHCKGTIARLPRTDRCTCNVPKVPVGFTHTPREKVCCLNCNKIIVV